MDNGKSSWASGIREILGMSLVIGSSLGVIALSIVIIYKSPNTEAAAQSVFNAVLPLLGTWVGTVLAYYYSKDNFEAANRGTLALVQSVTQQLQVIRVADKMMPAGSVLKITLPANKELKDVALQEIDNMYNKPGGNGQKISRLLFVDDKGACVAVMHRSIWLEMLAAAAKQTLPVAIATDLFDKLLPLPYPSPVGKTFDDFITGTTAFVAQDKTLADAKAAMEAKQLCQDVIVTASGKAGEPMIGWISNVDITQASKA